MAAPFGLSATGFRLKTRADILAELYASARAAFGDEVNLDGDSPLGQELGAFADRAAEIWLLAEAVYNAGTEDGAEGVNLDGLYALIGINRLEALPSTVTGTAGGTPTTLIPAGSVIQVTGQGDRFQTLLDAVIGGGGTVDIVCASVETGPIAAPAGTLTVIETPISGWDTFTNAEDADLGRNLELDAAYRIRKAISLQVVGAATLEAIRARLVDEVDGVIAAFIFENDSDAVVDGRPGHSFEVVISGGTDQDIADKIFELKALGIQAFGSTVIPVVDSQGVSHDIGFSRATDVETWLHAQITVDTGFATGLPQIDRVTIDNVVDNEDYTVTIDGNDFTVDSGGGASENSIATALVSEINTTGRWVPVTASLDGDEVLLTGDYPGNNFTVIVSATGTADISVSQDQPASGDVLALDAALAAFAAVEQGIGDGLILFRYNSPIAATDTENNVLSVVFFARDTVPDPDQPPPSTGWGTANIDFDVTERADLDSTRITVEVV